MRAKQLKKSLLLGLAFLPARAAVAQEMEVVTGGGVQWTTGLSAVSWPGDSVVVKGAQRAAFSEVLVQPYVKGAWTLPRGHEFSGQLYSLPARPYSNLRSAFVFDAQGHWVVDRNLSGGKKTQVGLSYTTKGLVSNKARMGVRRTREGVRSRGAGRRGMGVYLTRATNVSQHSVYAPGIGIDVEYVSSGRKTELDGGTGPWTQGVHRVARLLNSGESVVKGGVSATRLLDPLTGEAFRWYYLSVEVGLGTQCNPKAKIRHGDVYHD